MRRLHAFRILMSSSSLDVACRNIDWYPNGNLLRTHCSICFCNISIYLKYTIPQSCDIMASKCNYTFNCILLNQCTFEHNLVPVLRVYPTALPSLKCALQIVRSVSIHKQKQIQSKFVSPIESYY